mgnify:CR=1 FL=1
MKILEIFDVKYLGQKMNFVKTVYLHLDLKLRSINQDIVRLIYK